MLPCRPRWLTCIWNPLQNERIKHDIIKEAKLSRVIALAKDSEIIWEKVRSKRTQGDRQARRGRKPPTWDRKVKKEEVEPVALEEVPNRRA